MELYCDAVETVESKDGLTWIYIKDNHIIDSASWTWKRLYKSLVN